MSKNIHIKSFTFNPFQENTYVIYNSKGIGFIVDPGCYDASEELELKHFIDSNAIKIQSIVTTHGHVDHVLGIQYCKQTFNAPLYIYPEDEATFKSVAVYAPSYGFVHYEEASIDGYLSLDKPFVVDDMSFTLLYVPGHAPGHIAFYNEANGFCLAGDVLFKESIGRSDLPGGNHETLIHSIHNQMFRLPSQTIVYPGHGPHTTIIHEKKYNPYCAIG
jgi:glyoxylase-like metal-dependent hydrolase (beta-lactamase superfamily II)